MALRSVPAAVVSAVEVTVKTARRALVSSGSVAEFLLFWRLLVRRTVVANARETTFRRVFLEMMAEFTFRGQKHGRKDLVPEVRSESSGSSAK